MSRELHVDTLPDLTLHKRPVVSLVCKYIDCVLKEMQT